MKSEPWYKEGLRFACTGCGKCCTGHPGYVWVSEAEIQEMALFLKMEIDDFSKRYVRKIGKRFSLIELPSKGHDCVFLQEDRKCKVYGARPLQCRKFPFWKENLSSKEAWEQVAKECEGIHGNAPLIDLKTIIEKC